MQLLIGRPNGAEATLTLKINLPFTATHIVPGMLSVRVKFVATAPTHNVAQGHTGALAVETLDSSSADVTHLGQDVR